MFNRILRAFRNDVSLYGELKGNPQFALESWIVLAISIGVSAILATLFGLGNGMFGGIISGLATALGGIVGYLTLIILAWFIGIILAKGTGSFTDIRAAITYAYCIPAILTPVPYIGSVIGLWLLVTESSAIRETLGIGKGLTFFIVLISIVAIFVISFSIGGILVALLIGGK